MERTLIKDTPQRVGEKVLLKGWVVSLRDHGKITFIDLRDRSGVVQCVGQGLPKISVWSVVEINGVVSARPEKLVNPNLETGKVELQIEKVTIVTLANELPIPLDS